MAMSKTRSKKRSKRAFEKICNEPQARMIEPRNPLFNHPLMKKSHAHVKSNKAKRRAEKIRAAKEWYSQNSFIKTVLRIPFHTTEPQLCS